MLKQNASAASLHAHGSQGQQHHSEDNTRALTKVIRQGGSCRRRDVHCAAHIRASVHNGRRVCGPARATHACPVGTNGDVNRAWGERGLGSTSHVLDGHDQDRWFESLVFTGWTRVASTGSQLASIHRSCIPARMQTQVRIAFQLTPSPRRSNSVGNLHVIAHGENSSIQITSPLERC